MLKQIVLILAMLMVGCTTSVYALTEIEEQTLLKVGVTEEQIRAVNAQIEYGQTRFCSDWNNDGVNDVITGTRQGALAVYINIGTNDAPEFDDIYTPGVGPIDPGTDTNPCFVDWNNDGLKDLLMGNLEGTVYYFLNVGSNSHPIFEIEKKLNNGGIDCGNRSVPAIVDWNGDGKKDLLLGNSNGELYLYLNTSKDKAPHFNDEAFVLGVKVPENSTPYVVTNHNNGLFDILCGSSDGKVYRFVNHGTHTEPSFSLPEEIKVDGKVVNLYGDTSVLATDWDGDGKEDLIVATKKSNVFGIQINNKGMNLSVTAPSSGKNSWDDRPEDEDEYKYDDMSRVYFLKNVGTNERPVYKNGIQILISTENVSL